MGQRRMISKEVCHNDAFTDLSPRVQALYFHLCLNADDDGFCIDVASCMVRAHATRADLRVLIDARFLIEFTSGICVIKHWRKFNAIRKDRYNPSIYAAERAALRIKPDGTYTINKEGAPITATAGTSPTPNAARPRTRNNFNDFPQRENDNLNEIMYQEYSG